MKHTLMSLLNMRFSKPCKKAGAVHRPYDGKCKVYRRKSIVIKDGSRRVSRLSKLKLVRYRNKAGVLTRKWVKKSSKKSSSKKSSSKKRSSKKSSSKKRSSKKSSSKRSSSSRRKLSQKALHAAFIPSRSKSGRRSWKVRRSLRSKVPCGKGMFRSPYPMSFSDCLVRKPRSKSSRRSM
jgi:hypothetical protein